MKKIVVIIIYYPTLNERLLQLISENQEAIRDLELDKPPKIEEIEPMVKDTQTDRKISYQKRQKLEQRRFKRK